MEFILHFMYVVAIKDKKAWMGDSPAEISMVGFWNLVIVWLKVNLFRVAVTASDTRLSAPYTLAFLPPLGIGRRG
jgi:hypothetical protein